MDTARKLIDDLTELDTLKTWSLIVTMFGDNPSSTGLSGRQIGKLLAHIGIKPEAVRVALHRLKKDGWVISTKNGREVIYNLSDTAVEQTRAVYDDIYSPNVKYLEGWQLMAQEDDASQMGFEGIKLGKNLCLAPVSQAINLAQALKLSIENTSMPLWFVNKIIEPPIVQRAEALQHLAQTMLSATISPNRLDQAAIRLLFLHHWRKMALKQNSWAHIWIFPNGPLASCHRHITGLLEKFDKIHADQLD